MEEQIKDAIERFIDRMCLALEVKVTDDEDGRFIADLSGQDRDLLLERNGELLSALQLILPKLLKEQLEQGARALVIESQGFRESREEELREIAHHAAERVVRRGEKMLLSPMNPHERRIIHLALKNHEGVFTRSEGDGFLRNVGIHPKTD